MIIDHFAYYASLQGGIKGYQVLRITQKTDGTSEYTQIDPDVELAKNPKDKAMRKLRQTAVDVIDHCAEKHGDYHKVTVNKSTDGKFMCYNVFCDPARRGCGSMYQSADKLGKVLAK